MKGRIYVLEKSGRLVATNPAPYASEDVLQALVADHPELLAGDQMDDSNARRWLLVSREAPTPDAPDGGARWYLDILLLDQDSIPTLVEVKRSSDTRIRREVVGQMLDYAAHAAANWTAETIRAEFAARCVKSGLDMDTELASFLNISTLNDQEVDSGRPATTRFSGDESSEVNAFWEAAETNLRAGRMRLLFVADEIPSELKRVIEFLNDHMDPTEVLAVEIACYDGDGTTTLAPRLIGLTAVSERKKSSSHPRVSVHWDKESLLNSLRLKTSEEVTITAELLIDWAKGCDNLRLEYGDNTWGSLRFIPIDIERPFAAFTIWGDSSMEVGFEWMRNYCPFFEPIDKRLELLDMLRAVTGLHKRSICYSGVYKGS